MGHDDYTKKIERAFVELVDSHADDRGYGKGEFAAKMWPWMNPRTAATRWHVIRAKSAHTGKPQGVTLAEAQCMADALGEELSYLLVIVKESVKKRLAATKTKEKE